MADNTFDLAAKIAQIAATALVAAREPKSAASEDRATRKVGPTRDEAIGALNLLDMAKSWIGEKYLMPDPDEGGRMQ